MTSLKPTEKYANHIITLVFYLIKKLWNRKKQWLAISSAGVLWFVLLSQCLAESTGLWQLDLNGDWQVAQSDTNEWIAAKVPGCIHSDLLKAGKIPDPYFRDNEKSVQWVGEKDWTYKRTFQLSTADLEHERLLLHCDGLDTFATIKINGHPLGKTDNMFRSWEFDVKPYLITGENSIEILFTSPLPYIKKRNSERPLYEWAQPNEPKGRAWVRKEPCNFGWDWGPVLVTCGIWRNISLVAFNQARLSDVSILQDHSNKDTVKLSVNVTTDTVKKSTLKASVTVQLGDKRVVEKTFFLKDGKSQVQLDINQPQLWWPVGLGKQPLYMVTVKLQDEKQNVLDSTIKRIGLRTFNILEPDAKNSLRFQVNGVTFFSKGANWIPADAFANRVTPERLRKYVVDAVAVNMNTLRFWGGGYYEEDALFDACDELGVCVWMDLKYGCSSYPAFDTAFMHNVQLETRDNVHRLRHHPCIALWCGNNEISLMVKDQWSDKSMGKADYDKLFKDLLGKEVKTCAPQANYVSGSPECGDIHNWNVWHGGKTFEDYRNLTGFMSEFGFQSFPEPNTVNSYTSAEDRVSLLTPVMQWHQRSPNGNEKIRDMTKLYFKEPKNFENVLWLSQILQGYGIKMGAEYWRQNMPKSMGCIYWQYNDCWPVASWSSVDYYGRWKALHYMARRFYAPLLVSGLEDASNGTVQIHISSDRLKPCRGTLNWEVTDLDGKKLSNGTESLDIAPLQSRMVKLLNLQSEIKKAGANNLLVWLELVVDEEAVSKNMVTFVLPKELKLADPQMKTTIQEAKDGFVVTLKTAKPALWAWLTLSEMDAEYSDNFMHLTADAPIKVFVRPRVAMNKDEFSKKLQARSLFDTY